MMARASPQASRAGAVRLPTPLPCRLALALALVLALLFAPPGAADKLPIPAWSRDCPAPYERCASVEVYQNWTAADATLRFQVSARFPEPEGKLTVWYLGDGDDAALHELRKSSINVVVVHPRGGTGADPRLYPGDDSNCCGAAALPTAACAEEMRTRAGDAGGLAAFSVNQSAQDLNWLITALGKDKVNVVLAEGTATILALRYLQMRANESAAAVLVDAVDPEFHDALRGSWRGFDRVAHAVMAACDDDTRCSSQLGATEGAWERLQGVLAAAREGRLPCERALRWDVRDFGGEVRGLLSGLLQHPAGTDAAQPAALPSLLPATLYRLQRCNPADVRALTELRKHVLLRGGTACGATYPEDAVVRALWRANELPAGRPVRGRHELRAARDALATDRSAYQLMPHDSTLDEVITSLAALGGAYKAPRDQGMRPISFTTTKLLFVHTAMDPLHSVTEANNLAHTFTDGRTEFVHPRGGALHLPVAALYTCLQKNLVMFKNAQKWDEAVVCSTVDAAAALSFVEGDRQQYIGVQDGWEYTRPNPPELPLPSDGEESGSWLWAVTKTFFYLLLFCGAVAAGYVAWQRLGGNIGYMRAPNDEFFERLNP